MGKMKTKIRAKTLALTAALITALCITGGGITTAVRAEEEHVHNFSETYSYGYKNHWYECDCGTVKGMEEHNFVNGVCTECGMPKPDPLHVHNFDTSEWQYDTVNHWHQATCHGIVTDIAPHNMVNGECSVCGYSTVEKLPEETPDENSGNSQFPDEKVPVELPAEVTSAGGYNESLYAVWETSNVEGVTAYYKSETTGWTEINEQLIRMVDGNTARVDAVGLEAGEYSLKISSTVGSDIIVDGIAVTEYDRSGYAHFNYTSGVGAYNDDGTLKDGALVIYVTDANKNDITDFVYKNTERGLVKEDITAYLWEGHTSIGYLLNNRGYTNNAARENYGIQALSFKYGAVAVRLLDTVNAEDPTDAKVSLIEGLTAYSSTDNGGSVGDNGRMARITNAKNLTIEGIGENAGLYGWGVHFVSNDNLHKYDGSGESFEVRNLTFQNYPEDAIGMEGTQGSKVDSATGSITSGASSADSDLISPVERCWVHNNTFYPGYCASPAESDKAEGDGSCDFKRGQYYTLSYNYFEGCHKTNLIGSADASLTYNITMHHNWWNNCGSRQPLLRRANCHFYNNYASGDMSATPQPSLSYVTSARANSYMFSENNYFDGCKQVVLLASGGVVKAYGNTYYACFSTNSAVEAAVRTRAVANSCKFIYRGIDYSTFDTDPELFYYDAENECSDCLLDTAEVARVRVMMYAGVNGFGKTKAETAMNKYTPDTAVTVGQGGVNVDLTSVAKGSSVVSNVYFNGITGVSGGTVKGKGQIITFTLTAEAQLTVETTSTGDTAPELIGSDGYVYLSKFTGSRSVVLQAGTYVIATGQKEKESVITKLSFDDTSESSAARVKAAENAINALPAEITIADGASVSAAQQAYGALTAAEKESFNAQLTQKLQKAVSEYSMAQINDVIYKIADIGEVNIHSYEKINNAETAFNALSAAQQLKISEFYRNILSEALAKYADFAVQNVIDMIEALPELPANITDKQIVEELKLQYYSVKDVYDSLSDGSDEEAGQQDKVTNRNKLLDNIAELERISAQIEQAETEAALIEDFLTALGKVDADNLDSYSIGELTVIVNKHEALGVLAERLTEQEAQKYQAVLKAREDKIENQPKENILVTADDVYNSTNFELKGSLITVASATTSKKFSSIEVSPAKTEDGLTFNYALRGASNGNGILVTAGNKAVSVTIYFTTTDSSGAGKATTISWTDAAGSHTMDTVAADAASTVYKLEINLEAGGSCTLGLNTNRLVFYGAAATATE